jgi:protein TonB
MFDQQLKPAERKSPARYIVSVAVHTLILAGIALIGPTKVVEDVKEVGVKFVTALPAPTLAPPPPPPGGHPHKTHVATHKIVTKVNPTPKPKPKPEPEEEEDEVTGGVVGGQKGGVAGGVVGGVVGGTVGGLPPKNVPSFAIQKDALRQDKPHLSEVFQLSHRGRGTITGMYKVCVGVDGHVFTVVPVQSVPGADEDIIRGIKAGWVYKPQPVPVCFLYNMPITIQ